MSKESPLLFSGPMVQAMRDGSKTMTRRIVKKPIYESDTNPPNFNDIEIGDIFACPDLFPTEKKRGLVFAECESYGSYHCMGSNEFVEKHSPYGGRGDLIWVRETYYYDELIAGVKEGKVPKRRFKEFNPEHLYFRADGECCEQIPECDCHVIKGKTPWQPSIFMPYWICRYKLRISNVRVERLQDITEEDSVAEGCRNGYGRKGTKSPINSMWTARDRFECLWNELNEHRAPWADNPWVWVIEWDKVIEL